MLKQLFLGILFALLTSVCFKLLLFANQIFKMYTSMKKIQKDKDVEPTEFEQSVAQVMC